MSVLGNENALRNIVEYEQKREQNVQYTQYTAAAVAAEWFFKGR